MSDIWTRRRLLATVGAASTAALAGCSPTVVSSSPAVTPETIVEGLRSPWGLAGLPDRALLVTEKGGQLRIVDLDAQTTRGVDGVPEVAAAGQGGLLDVAVHPDFPEQSWVYLTDSVSNDAGESTTRLARGCLDRESASLCNVEVLFTADPFVASDGHYGSRVRFAPDGRVHATVGDRQFKNFGPDHAAQDLTNHLGCTVRLEPDGSIPEDNPFVDDPAARDELFTYGNRNPQGLAVQPETGAVWESEHGERDGDELNVLEAGGNYGWPVADHGCKYGTEEPVGDPPEERPDTVQPAYVWECGSGGFPPAGMAFYDGAEFEQWQGDLFVGTLAGQYLGRFIFRDGEISTTERLLTDQEWRIRDVLQYDDHLYVIPDADAAPLVRLDRA